MDRRDFVKRISGAGCAALLPGAGFAQGSASMFRADPVPPPAPRTRPTPVDLAFPEYEDHDALGLAGLVRDGEVTPAELLDAAVTRMETLNPDLNAIVFHWIERAREQARGLSSRGPFAGVPFLLKNLGSGLEDTPLTSGSKLLTGNRSRSTSLLVRRLLEAGVVPFGRGNAPEFGISATSEPLAHGPTRNPWNLSRTAGGSSGGAGAAVAAGIVPIAYASDGGGSARIPASCCGLVSLKATRGRTPVGLGPANGQALVVSRTVRDTAAALDVMAGPVPGAPMTAPEPARPFLEEVGRPPGRLRIGFRRDSPFGGRPLHPACVAAVDDVARLCESLGHEVEEAAPDYDFDRLAHAMFKVFMGTRTAATVDRWERELGRRAREDELEPYTWGMVEVGRGLSAMDYARGIDAIDAEARRFSAVFQDYDVFLSPTLGRPPLPLGELIGTIADEDRYLEILYGFMPFTMQYNASGRPAISLPLHWTEDGLPIGLQFGAGYGNDGRLIRLAAQLEEARPWFDRRPPMLG